MEGLLVLERGEQQSVICGDGQLEVIVLGFRCGRVRLGFRADKSYQIHRKEVWLRRQAEARPLPASGEGGE